MNMLWFIQFVSFTASAFALATLNPRQIQWPTLPSNLTENVLQIASAISPPCAANNTGCQQLASDIVSRCIRLRGDPGCWCGNHNQIHHCALCMSNPADNQTTPTQMEAATVGHTAFHVACNAYESFINGTDTMHPPTSASPTASASFSSNEVPVGPIVGGVVGGVVGLALVAGIIYLLSVRFKRNDSGHDVRPSSVSIFSSENKNSNVYAAPYPQLPSPYPGPVSEHVSLHIRESTYLPELMEPVTGAPQPRTHEVSK